MYICVCVCVCVYVSLGTIFFFNHVCLNGSDSLCLPILSLINSPLCVSCLTFGLNELRKVPYFFQVLSALKEAIFKGANNEMINTIMSHIHLHKEKE